MSLFIRVDIEDEHDPDLLSRVIKDIEKVFGVLEVYPVVEAAQQRVKADLGYCPVPTHIDYIQGVDGVRYCLVCHRPIR